MADRQRILLRLMSVWPPFAGAGVRVRVIGRDPLAFETRMKLRWWNRNYVGTHFGGSLYSMADPFYMLILIDALGPGYVVWDKSAAIRFRRPGRGTVTARFEIPAGEVDAVRRAADSGEKVEPLFTARILDADGEMVAEVEKRLHIRRREPAA